MLNEGPTALKSAMRVHTRSRRCPEDREQTSRRRSPDRGNNRPPGLPHRAGDAASGPQRLGGPLRLWALCMADSPDAMANSRPRLLAFVAALPAPAAPAPIRRGDTATA